MFFNFRFLALSAVFYSFFPLYSTQAFLISPSKPVQVASVNSRVAGFLREGNRLLERENYGSAIISFSKVLRVYPRNRDALYGRGVAYLRAYKASKNGSRVFYTGMNNLSPMSMLNNARWDLGRAVKVDSNFALSHLELGAALLEDKQFIQSIGASERTIDLGTPDVWRAHTNKGIALYWLMLNNPAQPDGSKYFVNANTSLLKGIELNPKNWLAYKILGDMHGYAYKEFGYEQANPRLAQKYTRIATTLYNQTPEGRRKRAEAQRRQREQQLQAARNYEQRRLNSWRNRPCTLSSRSILDSTLFSSAKCEEGYFDPNSPKGRKESMPSYWQP